MKRSEINKYLREGDVFFRAHQFYLPPFAYWTPADWARLGEAAPALADATEPAAGERA